MKDYDKAKALYDSFGIPYREEIRQENDGDSVYLIVENNGADGKESYSLVDGYRGHAYALTFRKDGSFLRVVIW